MSSDSTHEAEVLVDAWNDHVRAMQQRKEEALASQSANPDVQNVSDSGAANGESRRTHGGGGGAGNQDNSWDLTTNPTLGVLVKNTRHLFNAMQEQIYLLDFDQFYGTSLAPSKEEPALPKVNADGSSTLPISETERERIAAHKSQIPEKEAQQRLELATAVTHYLEYLTTLARKYDQTLSSAAWNRLCDVFVLLQKALDELIKVYPDSLNPTVVEDNLKPLTTEQVLFKFYRVPMTILSNIFKEKLPIDEKQDKQDFVASAKTDPK